MSLHAALSAACLPELLPHTRLTALHAIAPGVWLKREDDPWLGGNKLRKAASLIPWLRSQQTTRVALIGGAYSNHVAAMAQLLPQYGITVQAFLRGEDGLKPVGNQLLLGYLLAPEQRTWVPRSQWQQVAHMAADWATTQGGIVIPEGGCMPAATAGAATLALDIWRNENERGQPFAHIWLDSGTGLTAAATILALHALQPHIERQYHVVLLADDDAAFRARLAQVHGWMQHFPGISSTLPQHICTYRPAMAPRYGQVNATVQAYCRSFAQAHGILPDPIYTAKLLATATDWLHTTRKEDTPTLIVHSGGQVSLLGLG